MWPNMGDSKSPHLCGHFDSKIEVVTMNNIIVKKFQHNKPKMCFRKVESLIPTFKKFQRYIFLTYNVFFVLLKITISTLKTWLNVLMACFLNTFFKMSVL